MNTGFVRPVVATALTVYGIETYDGEDIRHYCRKLQQHLPFTVLKPKGQKHNTSTSLIFKNTYRLRY